MTTVVIPSTDESTRRRFPALAGTGVAALAGCVNRPDSDGAPSRTTTGATPTGTSVSEDTDPPIDAIERAAVPVELTADSPGLDTVAAEIAGSNLVDIGENSHGVAAFKTVPQFLVRRLVETHGSRLLAMEATLGDFAPVDDYVAGGDTALDDALAALDFCFWWTESVRHLFAWLREFNDDRPDGERVTVRGYDAQFHDANATAIRDYLERVDPSCMTPERRSSASAGRYHGGETSVTLPGVTRTVTVRLTGTESREITVRAYRISWTSPRSSTSSVPSSAPDVDEAFRISIQKYASLSRSKVPVTVVSAPSSARSRSDTVRTANGSVSETGPATR